MRRHGAGRIAIGRAFMPVSKGSFGAVAGAMLALAGVGEALAQAWPSRPVRVVVAFAPGGIADTVARLVSQKAAERLGQPVLVENRGGAGGNIATRFVAQAAPDGYTVLANTAAMAVNMSLYRNPGYDALADFAPVAVAASSPEMIAVGANVQAATLAALVRAAKETRGGRLNYATAGIGSSSHLIGEYLFRSLAGLDATHVPFQGGAPAVTAVVSGQVEVLSITMPTAVPHVKQGRLRGLAVASSKRVPSLPEVPTLAEAGYPDVEARSWVAFFAPAKTPGDVVQRLAGEVNDAIRQPDVRERLAATGFEPEGGSSAEFGAYLRREVEKWGRIVKATGVSAD
jgi:tripartite-type tricarboxylate transporter receptor subunit TctC